MENKKNKHLTLDDRIELQQCLDHKMTFKAIGARIGKDQTTVSKEIKKHLEFSASKVMHSDKSGNEVPSPVCPKLLKTPFVCNPCEKNGIVAHIKSRNTLLNLHSKTTKNCSLKQEKALP